MNIKSAWYTNELPNHVVAELPDGTLTKFFLAPFRKVAATELSVYKGHHPSKRGGYPVPPYVFPLYGLTLDDPRVRAYAQVAADAYIDLRNRRGPRNPVIIALDGVFVATDRTIADACEDDGEIIDTITDGMFGDDAGADDDTLRAAIIDLITSDREFQPAFVRPPMTAADMGRKGGAITSDRKAAAVRENGKRGGRPRKA